MKLEDLKKLDKFLEEYDRGDKRILNPEARRKE